MTPVIMKFKKEEILKARHSVVPPLGVVDVG